MQIKFPIHRLDAHCLTNVEVRGLWAQNIIVLASSTGKGPWSTTGFLLPVGTHKYIWVQQVINGNKICCCFLLYLLTYLHGVRGKHRGQFNGQ